MNVVCWAMTKATQAPSLRQLYAYGAPSSCRNPLLRSAHDGSTPFGPPHHNKVTGPRGVTWAWERNQGGYLWGGGGCGQRDFGGGGACGGGTVGEGGGWLCSSRAVEEGLCVWAGAGGGEGCGSTDGRRGRGAVERGTVCVGEQGCGGGDWGGAAVLQQGCGEGGSVG